MRQGNYVKGKDHPKAKLTVEAVKDIRRSYVPHKVTMKQLAKRHGVTANTVRDVIEENTWLWVPYD